MSKLRLSKELFSIRMKRFSLLIIIALTIFSAVFILFWKLHANSVKEKAKYESIIETRTLAESTQNQIAFLSKEVLQLASLSSITKWVENNDSPEILHDIQRDLLSASKEKRIYNQIRLLDDQGLEIVRIDFDNDKGAQVVQEDLLQDKGSRYYFEETRSLMEGQVYVSPLDLNIENSIIEEPLNPVMRFGTPLYNSEGDFSGIVILNYMGGRILNLIRNKTSSLPGTFSLINDDGYWLINQVPEYEWGFLYPDRNKMNMSILHPTLWHQLGNKISQQTETDKKIITSKWIVPAIDNVVTRSNDWLAVYELDYSELGVSISDAFYRYFKFFIVLFPIMLLLSAFINQIVSTNKSYQLRLKRMALYDSLTGLPNRHLFYDRLANLVAAQGRTPNHFAILFMDLDGFKAVNDKYGHEAGDKVLKSVSEKLRILTRKSDTISRFGGDEFVLLLANVKNNENCGKIASEIVKSISEAILIDGNTINIGCSIGIKLVEDAKLKSTDSLLEEADQAMYQAKKNGKNRYEFASEEIIKNEESPS
ncbi:GGDEF domain-containing protein [Oceanispirochaeta crateris]|uniref:GGDEF domain-containing protein n=1 Tax=Oceanispirochaeta crateris TaxID=2518645 RepID=A0A5C1QM51_9SPIO|nr:diguanylate cyclase [Oceanispirochaeta crateris]QEN08289.1 GGDEF domain-containing protein [Oceanispirochaeta crateris]